VMAVHDEGELLEAAEAIIQVLETGA
jgi:hypothetical protein